MWWEGWRGPAWAWEMGRGSQPELGLEGRARKLRVTTSMQVAVFLDS